MSKNNKNNRNSRKNFFTTANKPVDTMTAHDISFASNRIFRDIASGSLDPSIDGEYFKNPLLVSQLIANVSVKYEEANLVYHALEYCYKAAGTSLDYSKVEWKNRWQNRMIAYGAILNGLSSIQAGWDPYTILPRMMGEAKVGRNYLD